MVASDRRALLLVAESYHTADMYYATHYLASDPVIFLRRTDGTSLLVVTDFERETARGHSTATAVRGFQEYKSDRAPGLSDHERLAAIVMQVVQREGLTALTTTNSLPLFVADTLRAHGIDLHCQPDLLLTQRATKDDGELAAIEEAQRATERAMGAAVALLTEAHVGHDGLLSIGAVPLTSEHLHAAIEASLIADGCSGEGIIAAAGPASAEPHNRGSGPIHAGRPIVIDIFPRHATNRYFADMTRTLSKGTPAHEITRMYELTREALDLAIGLIRPGANGYAIFEAVCRFYEEHGYSTTLRNGQRPAEGFIHGLGHGVGLEIHEAPGLDEHADLLQVGQVVTVEPGLYRPGLGGVRLEDLVVVTPDGCRNLTTFPRTMVL